MKRSLWAFLLVLFAASLVFGQANGKLQLHFIDVGQGDSAILISPNGESVLFDNGPSKNCVKAVSYLDQLGITKIDYHVISHYHEDHIGCTNEVLSEFPLTSTGIIYDRGSSDLPAERIRDSNRITPFGKYMNAVGDKRKEAVPDSSITLDEKTANPVVIKFVASNGDGLETKSENDRSLVALISFGKFDAVMGGDLSGKDTKKGRTEYRNIETTVAKKVGQVEVYKVHHHCSGSSSNNDWLDAIKPKVGIISHGGQYDHPNPDCLKSLHAHGVRTYWTEPREGRTVDPQWDIVGGNIVVEVVPNSDEFKVVHNWAQIDTYDCWESSPEPTPTEVAANAATYAWSKKSNVYHLAGCKYVSNINPANLEKGSSPPPEKRLHERCPTR